MFTMFKQLLNDDAGVTTIEYALIAALIAVIAVTVMGTVGSSLKNTFNNVATNL